ncbi:uncharacterized protein LOC116350411 [Contarinia nasturtii]|uniref:uncharacterized protein LOC116350411 n=1 Tax=Contarinia nasturtii TaxID=265458 RepID=UPI0012D40089|nr:uncharacterized protein LOC116350411 [Contarinia nasturtii]
MFSKVICLAVFIAAICSAQETKPEFYPADVDPLLCPNYPHCDNALLHGTEKIAVLPSYQKSLFPGYRYYTVNDLTQVADDYIPASRYLYSPYAGLRSYISPFVRYATATATPIAKIATVQRDVISAPVLSVAPDATIAPNKVETTVKGDPLAPIAPFATLPGLASRLFVASP